MGTRGLLIRDSRGSGHHRQEVFGANHEQMVALHDPALTADRADPAAVTIAGYTELAPFARGKVFESGQLFESGQVHFFSWPPIMTSERPINLSEAPMVFSGKLLDQPSDIFPEDFAALMAAGALYPLPRSGDPAEFLDIPAKDRPAQKYHFEAVIIGAIVAASYLNAALLLFQ